MDGRRNLKALLSSMRPELSDDDFVFSATNKSISELIPLQPWAIIRENEAMTVVLKKESAERNGLNYNGVFRRITLNVHSSLEAVGLTAAVSTRLAKSGISANVVAGYYHDHIFVQKDMAGKAIEVLRARERENI